MPNILRDIEKRLEGFITDLFGRAFKSGIQPIEVARKLIWEMDSNKRVGISAVYVPNRYTVFFSPEDRERLAGVETDVVSEMKRYIKEHADSSGYKSISHVQIIFETDAELGLGEFGIATEFVQDEADISQSLDMRTMVYTPSEEESELIPRSRRPAGTRGLLKAKGRGGKQVVITGEAVTIGRSKSNDLVVDDSKTSRHHAKVVKDQLGRFEFQDLGSTNGSMLNGEPIWRSILTDGDVLTIGLTEVTFSQEVDN